MAEQNTTVINDDSALKNSKKVEEQESVSEELVRSVRQSFIEDAKEGERYWKQKR